ncbi:PHD/YefM family antitoxin component YafN of YafNO toxin-antitoxin module [Aequitasia blattaphilus]|uniref:Antitoxin n=1 Tax=Aequitasia blattaphilus TaxID=2949332 RepID=A0ABT1ECF0_9FIRM|nr:type II toxin-antitoxin system Phd/YefM family antitoxin [Aequitasia blattaphilus]MCP1103497.1 type II toxin-antitoxin system Phd/YefM family antitoxin [Aequitasia blattaphilus]MCR8616137.1 type II toxin-antitoxin system Phd/YefM family antitoxin [Aequitasia blattaphilus]
MQADIRPLSDLRNHYNDISKQCKESKEAIIITVNGRGDTAILRLQSYMRMEVELELYRILAEAENDVRNDRVKPIDQAFDVLRNM